MPGFWSRLKHAFSISTNLGEPHLLIGKPGDSWFRYTRGRFVCNEVEELSKRHVTFDMEALVKRALKSAGFPSAMYDRTPIQKFMEGRFNKTFLFTLPNGTEIVAKLPNPNAGRPFYTTASEVAMMDFARNHLQTPTPRVLDWCANASNPVGAEYIIMEKAAGTPLQDAWPFMSMEEQVELAKTISRFQKAWMSTQFEQYGSLYYEADVASSCGIHEYPQFAIGPSVARDWQEDGRLALQFDRGPWNTAEKYALAVGHREIACVEQIPQLPPTLLTLYEPGRYQRSRHTKIAALQNYLRLAKYLLPPGRAITLPTLFPANLKAENIFVNKNNPTEVTCILGWQSSAVLPLFEQACQPPFLDLGDPHFNLPKSLLRDLSGLSQDELDDIENLTTGSILPYYRTHIERTNRPLFDAMRFRKSTSFDMLYAAQNLLVDGEASYQFQCLDLESRWSDLPGVQAAGNPPFPLKFSADEIATIKMDAADAMRGTELMEGLKEHMGTRWPEGGFVEAEDYENVKAALAAEKHVLISKLAKSRQEKIEWDKAWPFDV
ncbi:hypothetical protein BJY04DRAFT_213581 [Aspergillus karnatakaensis]|uniref:uncharacterized protein n=1 Tax=Aspergillus karnatakaensis TaxID=1810916 RepID=UPI003CCDEC94